MPGSIVRLMTAASLMWGITSCAAPAYKCTAPDDIPPYQYARGMEDIDNGALRQAENRFDRAVFCDSGFSPAYSGLAVLYAEAVRKGGARERKPLQPQPVADLLDMANKHADGPQDSFQYNLARMRVNMMAKGNGWLEKVEEAYRQSEKLNVEDALLLYYEDRRAAAYFMGLAYLEAFDFLKARNCFAAVIAGKRDGKWHDKAERAWRKTDKIVRAMAGLTMGPFTRQLAYRDSISRADLAALLVRELKVRELLNSVSPKVGSTDGANPEPGPGDVGSHPFRNDIAEILALQVRGLEPVYDNSGGMSLFKPDEGVSRGELAVILNDVFTRSSRGRAVKGTPGHGALSFPDVRSTSPLFPAVAAMTASGVMEADPSGDFRINDIVDGAEVVHALGVLLETLER